VPLVFPTLVLTAAVVEFGMTKIEHHLIFAYGLQELVVAV
jgi:hypothetical protein